MTRSKIVTYSAFRQFQNDFSSITAQNRTYTEVWIVTPNYMVKETNAVALNRALGIHKVNMSKINMSNK